MDIAQHLHYRGRTPCISSEASREVFMPFYKSKIEPTSHLRGQVEVEAKLVYFHCYRSTSEPTQPIVKPQPEDLNQRFPSPLTYEVDDSSSKCAGEEDLSPFYSASFYKFHLMLMRVSSSVAKETLKRFVVTSLRNYAEVYVYFFDPSQAEVRVIQEYNTTGGGLFMEEWIVVRELLSKIRLDVMPPQLLEFKKILDQHSILPRASVSNKATGLLHQALLSAPEQKQHLSDTKVIQYYVLVHQRNYKMLWEGGILLHGGLISKIDEFLASEERISYTVLEALFEVIDLSNFELQVK